MVQNLPWNIVSCICKGCANIHLALALQPSGSIVLNVSYSLVQKFCVFMKPKRSYSSSEKCIFLNPIVPSWMHPVSLRLTLTVPSHLYLVFHLISSSEVFQIKFCVSNISHVWYIFYSFIFNYPSFNCPNNVRWTLQILKLLIM